MEKEERVSLTAWVEDIIVDFVKTQENSLKNKNNEPAWEKPLVGFSRGDDPLYGEIKAHIGLFYWEPIDVFRNSFPDLRVKADQLAVIAWVLPQTKATKADNRRSKQFPSERWARSRKFGEEFNVKLRSHVVSMLKKAGYEAVAPQLSPLWGMGTSEKYGMASFWSERHAAYVSGLGTFGLCDGLITPAGKAVRLGSVVARINISPTRRPYGSHNEYCLHYTEGGCGKCIDRCPAGAITKEGHDKGKCRDYIETVTAGYIKEHFGLDIYGCGLCQTRVPCESRIPARKDKGAGQ